MKGEFQGENIKILKELKRGFAPLKKKAFPSKESQREAKPLLHNHSPSPLKGEGDIGGEVHKITARILV
ncbi:MAG: hypothetical protein JSW24_03655, partial [Dehalococcoidia bacterium]